MSNKVAVIRGDGTGSELVDAMLTVLNATGTSLEFIHCDAGLEWWQVKGGDSFIPPESWKILHEAKACFKGPTTTLLEPGTPKSVAVSLRQKFDLYANIRPIKTFPNNVGPLGEVDFVCVREATEGMYSGIEAKLTDDLIIAIRKVSRRALDRVTRYAFQLAKDRGWKTVIVINKTNILKETDGLFLTVARNVAEDYPGIAMESYLVDNMAQQLVKNPQRFNQNILLSTNLFMDILSEEAAGLIGSIGCVYSANIGENYAMFEPAHGSAPKYKGLDKVNPIATILSGAWMLEYTGEKDLAQAVFKATNKVIAERKYVTYDLGGNAKTSETAKAIADEVNVVLRR